MIPLAKRLIVFWVVTTTVSIWALVRGADTDGGSGTVYTTMGLLGIACLLLFLLGWVRQSRRRR